MVDARGDNFVLWFPRTEEDAFLDTFSKSLILRFKCFLFGRKVEEPCLHVRGEWREEP